MVLTQQQSAFLHGCYEWLQQQRGIVIIPAQAKAQAAETLQKLENGYSLNLGLAVGYAAEFKCDERELVQNFRDQCVELSRTHRVLQFVDQDANNMLSQEAQNAGIEQVYFMIEDLSAPMDTAARTTAELLPGYWEGKQPYLLGHIVQYLGTQGVRCLDLCNHCALLNQDMFAMGGGNKVLTPYAAGHFGEGMKVQINRLIVDLKVDVTYTTGTCCWSFSHSCEPHCEKTTLHLLSNRLTQHHGHPSLDPSRLEETICSIHGAATKPVNNMQYLFLQPPLSLQPVPVSSPAVPAYVKSSVLLSSIPQWYPCIRVGDATEFEMEFLFAPHLHGKFFIHGILLKEVEYVDGMRSLHNMGINFSGSTKILIGYKLNRDRSGADVASLLCKLVPRAVALLSKQNPVDSDRLLCVVAHLYQELQTSPTVFDSWKWSSTFQCKGPGEVEEFNLTAQLLSQLLGPSQGLPSNSNPPTIPCSERASAAEQAEMSLLGYRPVKASDLLMAIWRSTKQLPTLEQLWQVRRVEVEAMPDCTLSWGPAERADVDKLLNTLAGLLLYVGPRLGLPPTLAAWRGSMKVLNLLNGSCYHENVVIPFKPDIATGQGPLLVFEAEYFKSLESAHRRLAAAGESCPSTGGNCGGKCIADLLLQETVAALGKMGVDSKTINRCVMSQCLSLAGTQTDKLGVLGAAAAPGSPTEPGTPKLGNGSATAPNVHVRVVEAPKVGGGPCANFTAPGCINSSIAGSLFAAQPHAAPQQVERRKGVDPEPVVVERDCAVEATLVVSSCVLAAAGGVTSYLYLPAGVSCTDQIAEAARQLHFHMSCMMREVFASSTAGTAAPQFFIYHDPERSSIAFNKGGQLWFNAAVKVELGGFVSPLFGLARFWYLVCCHELAHNEVKPHNSSFSDKCSAIVLQFADRFKAFAERRCGGCC